MAEARVYGVRLRDDGERPSDEKDERHDVGSRLDALGRRLEQLHHAAAEVDLLARLGVGVDLVLRLVGSRHGDFLLARGGLDGLALVGA